MYNVLNNLINYNFPFNKMPVTNGCFRASIIPPVFQLLTGHFELFAIWYICFCFSIIFDKYTYN